MYAINFTRILYLRGMAFVYLLAFLSFYSQISGLYGNNGVLPARNFLTEHAPLADKIHHRPTLLWFAPYLGLNIELMMDLISVLGILIAFSASIRETLCTAPIFAALWSLYYSLYQVGQAFMMYQWDVLLLEAGFITILVAPILPNKLLRYKLQPGDLLSFLLPRWLLFRLLFATGVVKMQSGCPSWWNLSALKIYFMSQPLPTSLAKYMYSLPAEFLAAGTVHAQIVEQILPFLFFVPYRPFRIIAFWHQVFLQVAIFISGNYHFYNILVIVLCLSLLDDSSFSLGWPKLKSVITGFILHAIIIFMAISFYGVEPEKRFETDWQWVRRRIFHFSITCAIPGAVLIATICFLKALYNEIKYSYRPGLIMQVFYYLCTAIYTAAVFFMFFISLAPFFTLHPYMNNSTLVVPINDVHSRFEHLQIANSYGFFRRMTGKDGRPEVVIEVADEAGGPWRDVHFKYKPGDIDSPLQLIAPYHPRLDWQMWFAAHGSYHQNQWILSLAYHILNGDKEVLQLMDTEKNSFSKPPKYVKASYYHYFFAGTANQENSFNKIKNWLSFIPLDFFSQKLNKSENDVWTRKKISEYFPVYSMDNVFLDFLKAANLIVDKSVIEKERNKTSIPFSSFLNLLRKIFEMADITHIIWALSCIIILETFLLVKAQSR